MAWREYQHGNGIMLGKCSHAGQAVGEWRAEAIIGQAGGGVAAGSSWRIYSAPYHMAYARIST